MIIKLFEGQQESEAMLAMTASIGHCINLICNNVEVFFDLISAVLRVSFKSNYDLAVTLTDFCTSLASINNNFNKLIFAMLYRELMALAPAPISMEQEESICRLCFDFVMSSSSGPYTAS